jgi:hypothetical protein
MLPPMMPYLGALFPDGQVPGVHPPEIPNDSGLPYPGQHYPVQPAEPYREQPKQPYPAKSEPDSHTQ